MMAMSPLTWMISVGGTLLVGGCSGLLPGTGANTPSAPTPPNDPTPLAKCHVAANSQSPLVTEWPASEKAHLQGLLATRTVAVAYSGCELRIVDACELPGAYAWHRTTLATDTVEIANADELYAKLPIGAVGLEGELSRSGRLAVRTTVSGQLMSSGLGNAAPSGACGEATHYISGISVGSFQMLSGSDASAGGGVSVAGVGGGGKSSKKESVLREAGSREACGESTDEAPSSQCASPIQVFLAPLRPGAASAATGAQAPQGSEEQMRATGVYIALPGPEEEGEVWTLRAPGARVVCTLPCGAWVGNASGFFLQREGREGVSQLTLDLPKSFAHPIGAHVSAKYQTERGNPTLAKWALWGAIPTTAMGVGLLTWGVVQAFRTCPDELDGSCFPPAGFLIPTGVMFAGAGIAGIWWYSYSREERFDTYEDVGTASRSPSPPSGVHVMLMPNGIVGTF
jgi:hypothetical protein